MYFNMLAAAGSISSQTTISARLLHMHKYKLRFKAVQLYRDYSQMQNLY